MTDDSPAPSDLPKRALIALFALALVVRLAGLDRSPWYDELFTLVHFAASPGDALGKQVAANNHPLASLLAWAAGRFTASASGLRLPFAVCGALAAPAAAWALARWDRVAALAAGAAIALSPSAVLASQQVRGYALLLPLACLALGLTLRALESPRRRLGVALAVTVALGLAAHATVLLLVVALIAVALRPSPGRREALLGLALGVGLGGLLTASALSRTAKFVRGALAVGPAGGLHPGPLTPTALLEVLGGGSSLLTAILLPLVVVGAAAGLRTRERRGLTVALGAPVVAGLALTLLRPLGYARFFLVLLPPLLLLAGLGVAALARGARGARARRRTAAALIALAALPAGWSLAQQRSEELMDYRGAVRIASERAAVLEDAVLIGVGPGGELLRVLDPRIVSDPTGDGLFGLLLDHRRTAVVIVPLPGWLEQTPDLRRVLYGGSFAAPLVLPGREGSVLVIATRTPIE